MNKLSKRAISIIVIATFLISMIPIIPALAITLDTAAPTAGTRYQVGDTIVVEGTGVTSGARINVYWDFVTTAGLMNYTQGGASGNFEVSLDVPDTFAGEHWIWVKDKETAQTDNVRVVVDPELDLSATSGLAGEELTADGTGYLDDDEISIYFGTPPVVLVEAGLSTASWATDPASGGTEDVVKLFGDSVSDARAGVLIASGPTMDTITLGNLGFDYYAMAVAVGVPEFELTFVNPNCVNPYDGSSNNRAHVQMTIATPGALTTVAWTTSTAITGAETVWVYGNKADGTPFGPIIGNWATVVTGIKALEGTAGAWVLTRVAPQVGWGVTGTYYIDDVTAEGTTYNLTSPDTTATSDDDGSWVTTFDIPDLAEAPYTVSAVGAGDFWDTHAFTIGACITTDIAKGPTGSIVTIEGRGFTTPGNLVTVQLDDTATTDMPPVDGLVTAVTITSGEFEAEFVVPDVAVGDYAITVTDNGTKSATASFEVNGVPETEVDPTYGSPGAVITVTGSNFTRIAGTEVYVTLSSTPISSLVTAETDADGSFEATFVSPAVAFDPYTVTATDEYSIDADDAFKVGLIALIINPISGEAGTAISITGIGFEPGTYNLTFGDELYADHGTVSVSEAISGDTFYVPNVELGVYEMVIIDTVENELSAHFTVTESTSASIYPAVAPTRYNVTLSGNNFADVAGAVTCEIYNSTEEWPMAVVTDPGTVPVVTDTDGNFTGFWLVDAILSIGDYTINVTDSEGLLVQLPFSVVAARVEVTPRKALFNRGDTITFDISNDFELPDSYIKIYSPDDTLYWITDDFTGVWVLVETLYTVPYYRQTANLNPMDLASDAPLGTWTYFFYETTDEELMNDTFTVGPSTAAQVDAMMEEVMDDLSGLSDDLASMSDDFADDMAGLSDDFADDIDALSSEIGDVASDVDGLSDNIASQTASTNAMGDRIDDLEGSMSDLGDSMGDIADASNSALDAAQDAADAATDAAIAAEGAGDAAKGLTGLVYGAIGASLIAALAAIVSLMQISKKIAG